MKLPPINLNFETWDEYINFVMSIVLTAFGLAIIGVIIVMFTGLVMAVF